MILQYDKRNKEAFPKMVHRGWDWTEVTLTPEESETVIITLPTIQGIVPLASLIVVMRTQDLEEVSFRFQLKTDTGVPICQNSYTDVPEGAAYQVVHTATIRPRVLPSDFVYLVITNESLTDTIVLDVLWGFKP